MPPIHNFRCNKCGFGLPPGWGGHFYVIDDNGNRVIPGHPGEERAIEAILGKNAPLEIRKARTGFNSDCLCLDCLHEFQMDTEWDDRLCPRCGSAKVKTTQELIDRPCPKCKLGTMRQIDTGLVV
jgi:hypothetical protein